MFLEIYVVATLMGHYKDCSKAPGYYENNGAYIYVKAKDVEEIEGNKIVTCYDHELKQDMNRVYCKFKANYKWYYTEWGCDQFIRKVNEK